MQFPCSLMSFSFVIVTFFLSLALTLWFSSYNPSFLVWFLPFTIYPFLFFISLLFVTRHRIHLIYRDNGLSEVLSLLFSTDYFSVKIQHRIQATLFTKKYTCQRIGEFMYLYVSLQFLETQTWCDTSSYIFTYIDFTLSVVYVISIISHLFHIIIIRC